MRTASTPVKGRFDEILVTVGPTRMRTSDVRSRTGESSRTYEALVYSNLPEIHTGRVADSDNAPSEIGGLQLRKTPVQKRQDQRFELLICG